MIYFFTPTAKDKNLGKAYNQYMELLPNSWDWAVLCDRDTMFLQEDYYDRIERAIQSRPKTGMFTCLTNRVGERKQCYQGKISDNPNIRDHKIISDQLKDIYTYKEIDHGISGFIMIIQKAAWQKVGKFRDGLLGVDNEYSQRMVNNGLKVVVIEGLYVFHYYRLNEGITYKGHLK